MPSGNIIGLPVTGSLSTTCLVLVAAVTVASSATLETSRTVSVIISPVSGSVTGLPSSSKTGTTLVAVVAVLPVVGSAAAA